MRSGIFAICCHILFYSKSGSALRVTELDDHHLANACSTVKEITDKYSCSVKCRSSDLGGGTVTLGDCLKKIKDAVKKVMAQSGDRCKEGEDATVDLPANGACANSGKKVLVYKKKAGASGDPHVVNMAGENFDILATGTFSLLSLTRATAEDFIINGTIARFGAKCGESFITDLEHTGGWIREAYNTEALKVRAVQNTPQKQSLQVNFGQKWEPLSDLQEMPRLSKAADAIQLDLSSVTVKVSAGKHWRHGWNFLNLDVQGLANLDDSIRVGGLLGYDDHTQALQADADCAMFTEAAGADAQSQQSCLSYLKAN